MSQRISSSILFVMIIMHISAVSVVFASTTLDATFKPVFLTPGSVTGIAPLPNGQVLIIGSFSTVNGVARKNVARLNADGSVDATFRMTTDIALNGISAVAVQGDGKVLIGGDLTYYEATESQGYLFRLNTDGSRDTTFKAGGYIYGNPGSTYGLNGPVRAIAVDGSGKILIGGAFSSPGNNIARLNSDGSADSTFNPGTGADGTVTSIARQSTGDIIIGGAFGTVSGTAKGGIARLGANGVLDTGAFGAGVSGGSLLAMAVQADDKILIGGTFSSFNNAAVPKMVRLTAAGALDSGFTQLVPQPFGPSLAAAGFFQAITSILSLQDKIIVGGWYPGAIVNNYPTDHNAMIYVLQLGNGAFYSMVNFKGQPTDLLALTRRSDGLAVAGGSFTQLDDGTDVYYPGLCLLSGTYYQPDPAFKPIVGGQADIRAVALQADGSIVAGGDFYLVGGTAKNGVARLNATGILDATLTTPATSGGVVTGVLVRDDGKLIMGGSFNNIAGQLYKDVALLSSTGVLEASAYVGGVKALAWYPGGKFLAATSYSPGIRRLNADLTIENAATFNPGTGVSNIVQPDGELDRVNAVAVQTDGKILAGGSFSSFNNTPIQNIVRLNADGSLDAGFSPLAFTVYNFRSEVFSIALQADGKILLAGRFSTVGGVSAPGVVRLNPNGTVDATFSSPLPDSGLTAYKVYAQGDGKVLVGGDIQIVEGNNVYNSLVRLNPDGSRDTTFNSSITGAVKSILVAQALPKGGQLLVGGPIGAVDNTPRQGLARYLMPDLQYLLTVSKAGTGGGVVTADSGTISWSGNNGAASYDIGKQVILTAAAATGSTFTGWSGGGCSGSGTCTVTMTDAKNVSATFTLNRYTLKVITTDTGAGTVTAGKGGIACASGSAANCSAVFPYNTSVDLYATPSWYSLFGGWTDNGCSGKGACTVVMDSPRNVTAAFTRNLTVRLLGTVITFYPTLQEAFNAATAGGTVQARVFTFLEDLMFNQPVTVILEGGKDTGFNPSTGFTTVEGSLKIVKGTLISDRISIR
jgi:uncharacterized delta-60 repeat protein